MYNPLFSFLRPQRFFGGGDAGGANDSSNDNDSDRDWETQMDKVLVEMV